MQLYWKHGALLFCLVHFLVTRLKSPYKDYDLSKDFDSVFKLATPFAPRAKKQLVDITSQ